MAQRNRSLNLKSAKSLQALSLTHPNAAGIDIDSAAHFVAVPPDRDDEPVREFSSFTTDLEMAAGDYAGTVIDESSEASADLESCIASAKRCGYVYQQSQPRAILRPVHCRLSVH